MPWLVFLQLELDPPMTQGLVLERRNPRNTMMMFILTRMRKKCSQEVGVGGDGGGDSEPVKLNVRQWLLTAGFQQRICY